MQRPASKSAAQSASRQDSPARQFARLWQSQAADLDAFLAAQGDLSFAELAAVVRIDLRERRLRGEAITAETMLTRFPQLSVEAEWAVDVVYSEYLVREQLGQQPALEEYMQRFPEFAETLADQIRLHEALAEPLPPAETQLATGSDTALCHDAELEPPQSLQADYEILEELGRGGMGVAYKARQPALNRFVALKMVRSTDRNNAELLARFRAEAEVVASLHHPHIVQVYDYGQHAGEPYLALELVEGGTLAERLDGTPWNGRRAALLVEQLARAVHFAHQRGVVHRDLKPNNLLVSNNNEPLELKIADFGLAKMFRDTPSSQTQTGVLLGTPSYMAPEQAYGRSSAIGPATDIYSLGAILYELLSGRPPCRGETPLDTLQQLLLAEPTPLTRLVPAVPRDLATICAKCLERNPARRYASALELADDLHRFLEDRPIYARPSSALERGWRWCRRNPALATAIGAIAALLVTVTAVSTWYSGKLAWQLEITKRAEQAERKATDDAQLRLWDAYLAEVSARNASRQFGQRYAALETIERAKRLLPEIGATDERILQLRSAAINSLSLPDFRRTSRLSSPEPVINAAAAFDAGLLVLGTENRNLVVMRTSDHAIIAQVAHGLTPIQPVISPAGQWVGYFGEREVRVWTLSGTSLAPAWSANGCWLTFAPDNRHAIISRTGSGIELVEAATGRTVRHLSPDQATSPAFFHSRTNCVAICTASDVRGFDLATGQQTFAIPQIALQLAWHPDGEHLACWGRQEIKLWHVPSRESLMSLPHPGFPQGLQFSADGIRLVSCSLWDMRLVLWNLDTAQQELERQGFANLAFGTDRSGRCLLVKNDAPAIEFWELAGCRETRNLPRAWYPALGNASRVEISPDNRLLAISSYDGFELWDLARRRRLVARPGPHTHLEFDRQGNLILANPTGIFRWPRHDDLRPAEGDTPAKLTVTFGPPSRVASIGVPSSLAQGNPDDVILFEAHGVWQSASLRGNHKPVKLHPSGDPRKAAVSPDERFAVIANWDLTGGSVWDLQTGTRVRNLDTGRHAMLEFSPDGRWLATTPGGVQLWNTNDWSLARELHAEGTTPSGLGIAFSPDSRVLVIGQPNGELRIVDPATGKDWARIMNPSQATPSFIAISPDNRTLVTLSCDHMAPVRVWNLVELRRALSELDLNWPADVLRPAPAASDQVAELEVVLQFGAWQAYQRAHDVLRTLRAAQSP